MVSSQPKNIKICILGSGHMAERHAAVINAMIGVELSCCASRNVENARNFANKYSVSTACTLEDAIAKPNADALLVAVNMEAMTEVCITAASCKLPMLIEKPAGLTAGQVKKLTTAISSPHMVGLNRRYYEVLRAGRQYILEANGLRSIQIEMSEDLNRHAQCREVTDLMRRQWQFANSVHMIDLFRFFGGDVLNVVTENIVRSDLDRSYNGLLTFENGARGTYSSQWFAPVPWRLSASAEGTCIVFDTLEKGHVSTVNQDREPIEPQFRDRPFMPGLWGQMETFCRLVGTGISHEDAVDMENYAATFALVDKLTRI